MHLDNFIPQDLGERETDEDERERERYTFGTKTIACVRVVPMITQPDIIPYISTTLSSRSNENVSPTADKTNTL